MDESLGGAVIPSAVTKAAEPTRPGFPIEGSRGETHTAFGGATLHVAPRDPSPPLRSAQDDRKKGRSARDEKAHRNETAGHLELKRLALLWAQENGYPIAALEVSVPQCRYRADVAAYRPEKTGLGFTAIFECKQSGADLHRDDCHGPTTRARLESVYLRRQILEKHLRIHYPTLRTGDSLFPEWDTHDFGAIEHRGYARVTRELAALQARLRDGRKFEKLARYGCANLFFLVTPAELLREAEAPLGWGVLVQRESALMLHRKPVWHESAEPTRLRVLQKIAAAGTRQMNRRLKIVLVFPGER